MLIIIGHWFCYYLILFTFNWKDKERLVTFEAQIKEKGDEAL